MNLCHVGVKLSAMMIFLLSLLCVSITCVNKFFCRLEGRMRKVWKGFGNDGNFFFEFFEVGNLRFFWIFPRGVQVTLKKNLSLPTADAEKNAKF